MHQQRQAELLSQLATLLESINPGTLPVTESLKLRHLVDCLCHPSAERERAFLDTSGVDETVKALKRFKANLKRRSHARDKLTTKRLIDLPDDARALRRSLNWRYQGNKKPPSKRIAVWVGPSWLRGRATAVTCT